MEIAVENSSTGFLSDLDQNAYERKQLTLDTSPEPQK